MIPKAITAVFRWWAKHPWIVVWGLIPIVLLINDIPSNNAPLFFNQVLVIAWILSFIRGVFVTWQRSGIRAVLINVGIPFLLVYFLGGIENGRNHAYRIRRYDGEVRNNLKHAAEAEEAYDRENGTYTANIGNLKGFNQSDNVNITIEATATTYVIIGTRTKGCEAYTGRFYIDSTTGKINGTPCR